MKETKLKELNAETKNYAPHLLLFSLLRLRTPFFDHGWQSEGVHQKYLGKS